MNDIYAGGPRDCVRVAASLRCVAHVCSALLLRRFLPGETYNASLETPGWTAPGFDDSAWSRAQPASMPSSNVIVSSHAVLPTIQIGESYTPCNFYQSSPGMSVRSRVCACGYLRGRRRL